MPRPSETDRGRLWLSNFEESEFFTARKLLDSLHIVSANTFRYRLIERLVEAIRLSEKPVAIYPVVPKGNSQPLTKTVEPEVDEPHPLDTPAWDAGSELIVSTIVRDCVRKAMATGEVYPKIGIEKMRQKKVRTVLFVDDYIGSGSTLSGYLDHWLSNRTIQSWRSGGFIKFSLASYSISRFGSQQLQGWKLFGDRVFWVEPDRSFDSTSWTYDERDAIVALCRRYARKPETALGWRNSAGLLVLPHTVPNNLPAILTQSKGGGHSKGKWKPFFGQRSMPNVLQRQLGDIGPGLTRFSKSAGQGGDNLRAKLAKLDRMILEILLKILISSARGTNTPERIAESLRVALYDVTSVMEIARRLELLDKQDRLTDDGWQTLRIEKARLARAARKQPSPSQEADLFDLPEVDIFDLQEEDDWPRGQSMYYPTSLRSSR